MHEVTREVNSWTYRLAVYQHIYTSYCNQNIAVASACLTPRLINCQSKEWSFAPLLLQTYDWPFDGMQIGIIQLCCPSARHCEAFV